MRPTVAHMECHGAHSAHLLLPYGGRNAATERKNLAAAVAGRERRRAGCSGKHFQRLSFFHYAEIFSSTPPAESCTQERSPRRKRLVPTSSDTCKIRPSNGSASRRGAQSKTQPLHHARQSHRQVHATINLFTWMVLPEFTSITCSDASTTRSGGFLAPERPKTALREHASARVMDVRFGGFPCMYTGAGVIPT